MELDIKKISPDFLGEEEEKEITLFLIENEFKLEVIESQSTGEIELEQFKEEMERDFKRKKGC